MIKINDVEFEPNPLCKYLHDYTKAYERVETKVWDGPSTWRALMREDLFFLVHFVLKIPGANNPFVVTACNEVMTGPRTDTLDLWAREHFKSSIITTAETIQDIIRNPEERIAIISFSQRASLKLFRQIKYVFETSEILKTCYPDILYQDPQTQSWKWSEDSGLWVQRQSMAKEATLEAWSLLEGMPTGAHFTKIVYDDVETADTVNSPEIMQKLKDAFDMSLNLSSEGGRHRVVGTTYHYEGLLEYLREKKNPDGTLTYNTRKKPATVDGSFGGEPVLLSKARLDSLRGNRRIFAAQQLLDPASQGIEKLDPKHLVEVFSHEVPSNLYKFITIDPAGVSQRKDRQDSWAILCIGVQPFRDDIGASNIYVLDAVIEPMTQAEAMDAVVEMYCRNGRVLKIGVEKVALSSTEIHISNALRVKGRHLSIENGGIVLLRPGGRKKEERIEANIQWPLVNGKIHLSASVPIGYRERIKMEMSKFPFWHDDALDGIAYFYDMIKDYRFGTRPIPVEESPDWKKRLDEKTHKHNWMIV